MPELSQIRNFRLKVLFLIHFVFISLSLMGHWTSDAYLFYNILLIFLFLWSLYHDQSHEPIQLAIAVNGCSIFFDILILIMGFPYDNYARSKFSAAMAILHLIIRPFSVILLIKNLEERSGATGVLTGLLPGGQDIRSETYEDLDRPNIPQSSGKTGGYDFSSAQQI